MQVRFFPPYDAVAGRRVDEFSFDTESVPLVEFLERLTARYPGLREYVSTESDEALRRNLMVVVGSELMSLRDKISGEKAVRVKLLPPIAGGAMIALQIWTRAKGL